MPKGSRNGSFKHGMSRTTTHVIWKNIIQRCTNPNNPAFKNYGGRGISICERWNTSFDAFVADMGERPPGKTIDRIDNDGNYEPGNCRWVTRSQQNRNRRDNVIVEINGRAACLAEWASYFGISKKTVNSRIKQQGWSVKSALTTPVGNKRRGGDGN